MEYQTYTLSTRTLFLPMQYIVTGMGALYESKHGR